MADDEERRAQRLQRNLETMARARESMHRVREAYEQDRIDKILRAEEELNGGKEEMSDRLAASLDAIEKGNVEKYTLEEFLSRLRSPSN